MKTVPLADGGLLVVGVSGGGRTVIGRVDSAQQGFVWKQLVRPGFSNVILGSGQMVHAPEQDSQAKLTAVNIADGSDLWQKTVAYFETGKIEGDRLFYVSMGEEEIDIGAPGQYGIRVTCRDLHSGALLWSTLILPDPNLSHMTFDVGSDTVAVSGDMWHGPKTWVLDKATGRNR